MAEPAGTTVRYTAFLSYSHKDAAAAGRLHRRLEAYRLPKRLAGSETARGIVPERLWPIFRDREELPAATDLSETVREALAQSGALIVLCSPHSAGSLWVAEEIKVFREIHPDRPILAAILEGDPPDCFPAALRAFGQDGTWHEPLATDLRRGRDGAQLGLLKLVAGITGVGLDALVQRDAARKIRRVTAVTAVAVVAMLIMAALALVALDARREAERQRAEAEALVEFMLTDLRDRLQGVGSLDVMEAVNARALAYYESRPNLKDLPDESLARRARVLHAVGDDEMDRHDFVAALAAYRQAHQTTAEQLARSPNDLRRIFAHAKSDLGIGRVYEERENWPESLRYFQAAVAAADRLVAADSNNAEYMMKAGASRVGVGNVQFKGMTNYISAQRSYERAVTWFRRAAQIRPCDYHVLLAQANAHASLADSFYVRSLWRRSLDERVKQYEIMEPLHEAEPENAETAFRLAAAHRGVAYSYFRLGDRVQAQLHLFQAYRAAVGLAQRDRHNAQWRELKRSLTSDLQSMHLSNPSEERAPRRQARVSRRCPRR